MPTRTGLVMGVTLTALIAILPGTVSAAPPTVGGLLLVTLATDTGDGVCDATCTLRDAVAAAAAPSGPDTVGFEAGLAGQTITLRAGQLLLTGDVRIDGVGRAITINGDNRSRIVEVASTARAELLGLT